MKFHLLAFSWRRLRAHHNSPGEPDAGEPAAIPGERRCSGLERGAIRGVEELAVLGGARDGDPGPSPCACGSPTECPPEPRPHSPCPEPCAPSTARRKKSSRAAAWTKQKRLGHGVPSRRGSAAA